MAVPTWLLEHMDDEERAEVEALDAKIPDLKARFEASLTDEQKRLAFELNEAESDRCGIVDEARRQAFLARLSEHFPGLGPGLVTVANHVAWGGDREQPGCCELPEHGIEGAMA